MRDYRYFVYLLASRPQGALYIGVTNDLGRRVQEHRDGQVAGYTRVYRVKNLVWFEEHGQISDAIAREKQLKRWRRAWKVALIEQNNPLWIDLFKAVRD